MALILLGEPSANALVLRPQRREGQDRFPAHGHQAYLIHAKPTSGTSADGLPLGAVSISGNVSFHVPTWKAGQYNLLGFQVGGAPTFADYLTALGTTSGSVGGTGGTVPVIQRLDSASVSWVGVTLGESIQAGQAYWVWAPYSLSRSHYAGPVAVQFEGSGGLSFGSGPGTIQVPDPSGTNVLLSREELSFTSLEKDDAHAVTIRKISPASEDLRLFAQYIPSLDSLDGSFADIRRFGGFRAYDSTGALNGSQLNGVSRLISRSVWNTRWMLIIPGATLHSNPETGLQRLIGSASAPGIGDVLIQFQTGGAAANGVSWIPDSPGTSSA